MFCFVLPRACRSEPRPEIDDHVRPMASAMAGGASTGFSGTITPKTSAVPLTAVDGRQQGGPEDFVPKRADLLRADAILVCDTGTPRSEC